MTNKEAIARIREHMLIHKMNEPRAIYISEALDMAIKALEHEHCEDIMTIHNAIIIPKGATNGEVIKAIFPNELLTSITSTLWWGDNMSFNKDWWNAPYKKEVEE